MRLAADDGVGGEHVANHVDGRAISVRPRRGDERSFDAPRAQRVWMSFFGPDGPSRGHRYDSQQLFQPAVDSFSRARTQVREKRQILRVCESFIFRPKETGSARKRPHRIAQDQ
jgi:hypothetical protein